MLKKIGILYLIGICLSLYMFIPRPITISQVLNAKPACSETSRWVSKSFFDIISKSQDIESNIVAYIVDEPILNVDSDSNEFELQVDGIIPSQSRVSSQRILGVFRNAQIQRKNPVIISDDSDSDSEEYVGEILPSQSRVRSQRVMGVFRKGQIRRRDPIILSGESETHGEAGDA